MKCESIGNVVLVTEKENDTNDIQGLHHLEKEVIGCGFLQLAFELAIVLIPENPGTWMKPLMSLVVSKMWIMENNLPCTAEILPLQSVFTKYIGHLLQQGVCA